MMRRKERKTKTFWQTEKFKPLMTNMVKLDFAGCPQLGLRDGIATPVMEQLMQQLVSSIYLYNPKTDYHTFNTRHGRRSTKSGYSWYCRQI